MKPTSVREHRNFDETFKKEAVLNWLHSGKSAAVVGEELGINANLLYAWRGAGGRGRRGQGGDGQAGRGRRSARPVGRGPTRKPPLARAVPDSKKTLGILSEPPTSPINASKL